MSKKKINAFYHPSFFNDMQQKVGWGEERKVVSFVIELQLSNGWTRVFEKQWRGEEINQMGELT